MTFIVQVFQNAANVFEVAHDAESLPAPAPGLCTVGSEPHPPDLKVLFVVNLITFKGQVTMN